MWLPVLLLTMSGCHLVFDLETVSVSTTRYGDANFVFVSSSAHDGNLGGLDGADAFCQAQATAAGLDGSFVAWLSSDDPVNAIDRLKGSRGWVRVDGEPVADLPTDLGIRGPLVPISITEGGDDVRGLGLVWTGTAANGTKVSSSRVCASWTSANSTTLAQIGDPALGSGGFTEVAAPTLDRCNAFNRVYCFGTGKVTEIRLPPPMAPIMFVSEQLWSPTAGIASADAVCAQEAADADLPGTYQAALATSTQSIASRFPNSHEYVRVDGVKIGRALSAALIDTFVNLTAAGQRISGDTKAWTGGVPGLSGSTQTCNDWVAGAGDIGIVGEARAGDGRAFHLDSGVMCTDAHRIYCLAI